MFTFSQKETYQNCKNSLKSLDKSNHVFIVNVKCLPRHFEDRHSKEPEVAKAMMLRLNSKEQKLAFEKIRLLGNYQHNRKVLCIQKGELEVVRHPSREEFERDPSEFLPCLYCFGFIRKKDLVKHAKTCQFKPEDKVINTRYLRGKGALLLTNPVSPSNSKRQLIASVLKILQQDTITDTARSEEVFLTFGASLFQKSGIGENNLRISKNARNCMLVITAVKAWAIKRIIV